MIEHISPPSPHHDSHVDSSRTSEPSQGAKKSKKDFHLPKKKVEEKKTTDTKEAHKTDSEEKKQAKKKIEGDVGQGHSSQTALTSDTKKVSDAKGVSEVSQAKEISQVQSVNQLISKMASEVTLTGKSVGLSLKAEQVPAELKGAQLNVEKTDQGININFSGMEPQQDQAAAHLVAQHQEELQSLVNTLAAKGIAVNEMRMGETLVALPKVTKAQSILELAATNKTYQPSHRRVEGQDKGNNPDTKE